MTVRRSVPFTTGFGSLAFIDGAPDLLEQTLDPGEVECPRRLISGLSDRQLVAHEVVGDPYRLGQLEVRPRDRDPTSGERRLGALACHRDGGCSLEIHGPRVTPGYWP